MSAGFIFLVVLTFVSGYSRGHPNASPIVARASPLTSFRGSEAHPALSPDGERVAFTWNGDHQDNFDIYVLSAWSERPVRLTSNPADDISPAWSPDGRRVAFLRRGNDRRAELLVIESDGGAEHRIAWISDHELGETWRALVSLSWSPDGRWIAAANRGPHDLSERIYLYAMDGVVRVVSAGSGVGGDHSPAFSPDGRKLVFSRRVGYSMSRITVLPLDGYSQPAGDTKSLTPPERWSDSPAWTPDGRIAYLEAPAPRGATEFRMISADGTWASTSGVQLVLPGEPSQIALGKHLVFSRSRSDANVWRAKIPRGTEKPSAPQMLISSTFKDVHPRYSRDGKFIAFLSNRSGTLEIWTAAADGSNPVRITNFNGPLVGLMDWSPDGRQIAFHARPEGHADIFVVAATGGVPARLTAHPGDDATPAFSPDGRWIYFCSERSGQAEIWRMGTDGSDPQPLTTSGGRRPYPSTDGRTVYYFSSDFQEIRSVSASGGAFSRVTGPTHEHPSSFAVSGSGIYYTAAPDPAGRNLIRFFRFDTRQDRAAIAPTHPTGMGMSVSPDGQYIAFEQFDEADSDLMIVRNVDLR